MISKIKCNNYFALDGGALMAPLHLKGLNSCDDKTNVSYFDGGRRGVSFGWI